MWLKLLDRTVFERFEDVMGKGGNTGYHYFLLFPKCFQSLPFFSTKYPLYIIPRRQNFTIILNEKHLEDETKFLTNDESYIS